MAAKSIVVNIENLKQVYTIQSNDVLKKLLNQINDDNNTRYDQLTLNKAKLPLFMTPNQLSIIIPGVNIRAEKIGPERPGKLHLNSKPPKKALLIGIRYTAWGLKKNPSFGDNLRIIPAAHNNVKYIKDYLLEIGMNEADIEIISDQDENENVVGPGNMLVPTRARILEGFQRLRDHATTAGDVLFLYCNAHGTQLDALEDPPIRASRKVFLPVDVHHDKPENITRVDPYKNNPNKYRNAITGDDFVRIFGDLAGTDVNVTAVMQVCHSTGIFRDITNESEIETDFSALFSSSVVSKDGKSRGAGPTSQPSDKKPRITQEYRPGPFDKPEWNSGEYYQGYNINLEIRVPYIFGMTSAHGWEVSRANKQPNGIRLSFFTYNLVNLLTVDASITYGNIQTEVAKLLEPTVDNRKKRTQTPQLVMTEEREDCPFLVDLVQQFPKQAFASIPRRDWTRPYTGPGSDQNGAYRTTIGPHGDRTSNYVPPAASASSSTTTSTTTTTTTTNNNNNNNNKNKASADIETNPAKRQRSLTEVAATQETQQIVNLYSQIAANPDLQKQREKNRGLFDALIEHAVPFALNAAHSAMQASENRRDFGSDPAIERCLPTAINFAHQIMSIPDVQERGLFDKLFSIGMPLVLNTVQTLTAYNNKRGLSGSMDEAQRGFFDAIIGQLPATVFNVLSSATSRTRDTGDDRGFFDILKRLAPVVLNVAHSAVGSLQGQRDLSFIPTDRGFFSKLKKVVKKVINNPMVKKLGGTVLKMGMSVAQNALGGGTQQAAYEPAPSPDIAETQVRGFFGSMLQSLTPIAMGTLQGAVRSQMGSRDLDSVPQEGTFDIVGKSLPAVILLAQTAYSHGTGVRRNEDEAAYLQRILATSVGRIVAAACEQSQTGVDKELVGSIFRDLFV